MHPGPRGALYARSFRDALQRMARYKQLTYPEKLRVTEHENECRVQFAWLLAEEDEPAHDHNSYWLGARRLARSRCR